MPKLVLFSNPISQPGRVIEWILKLNKIPYEFHLVRVEKGETKTEEFKKMNKFGKIPVLQLEDGSFLSESQAIFRHLCFTGRIDKARWYPFDSDPRRAHKIDAYLNFHEMGLRQPCVWYMWRSYLHPLVTGRAPDPKDVEQARKGAEKALDLMDEMLRETGFVAGTRELSFGDLAAFTEVSQLEIPTGSFEFSPSRRVALAAWMKKISQVEHFEEVNAMLFKLIHRQKQKHNSKM